MCLLLPRNHWKFIFKVRFHYILTKIRNFRDKKRENSHLNFVFLKNNICNYPFLVNFVMNVSLITHMLDILYVIKLKVLGLYFIINVNLYIFEHIFMLNKATKVSKYWVVFVIFVSKYCPGSVIFGTIMCPTLIYSRKCNFFGQQLEKISHRYKSVFFNFYALL